MSDVFIFGAGKVGAGLARALRAAGDGVTLRGNAKGSRRGGSRRIW